jgi:hypothetical protein
MIAPSVQRPLATVVIVGLVHGIRPATTKAEIELWKDEVLFSELMRQLKCGWRTVVDGIVLLHSESTTLRQCASRRPLPLLRASLQPLAGERLVGSVTAAMAACKVGERSFQPRPAPGKSQCALR